ncbi:MAG: hypothetical protein LBD49_03965 [Oscillospiraceae bacterium]|jgi:hypothetical protein|nr:hypothetical protein [Oscillospiraceae bacterium]
MSKIERISKSAIAMVIVAVLAVGGIALAGTVAVKVYAEPQLTATDSTHLLPGRYRNTPQYFYSQQTAVDEVDEDDNPLTFKTVYVPAKHGDNLINSYEINEDGSIELLVQEGTIVVQPPYGPVVVQTTYFTSFGVVDEGTGEVIPLIDPDDPVPGTGIYELTIPAEYVAKNTDGSYAPILIEFAVDGTPDGHTSEAYLIFSPELVQVAYTYPIPATFPIEPTPPEE